MRAGMIPKAMRMTIYVGGGAAMLVCLALILAVPDMKAVISGKDTDPVATILRSALGEIGFRAVIVVVLVSFISCAAQHAGRREPAAVRLRA